MSDQEGSLILDDNPSATPLDLLLNAISGSGQYVFPQDEGEQNGDALSEKDQQRLRGLLEDGEEQTAQKQKKIAETITSQIVLAAQHALVSRDQEQTTTFSTVEVWHPTTAQKSYGKERRILNPPPIVRARGPILPSLTSATLSSVTCPGPPLESTPQVMSNQTHHIPLSTPQPSPAPIPFGLKPKKLAREEAKRKLREAAIKSGFASTLPMELRRGIAKEREALSDGLAFTGLYVGEAVGKSKEFKLELTLGKPGEEAAKEEGTIVSLPAPIDHSTASLVDHLQAAAEASAIDPTPTSPKDAPMPQDSTSESRPIDNPLEKPWATLTSAPLTIVSKPSQKTAKARSMASCMSKNDSFSLWVRINGQTVRTKYMKVEACETPLLAAKTGKWTPFRFEMVQRAAPPPVEGKGRSGRRSQEGHDEVMTYGSIVRLVDLQTGVQSEAVKLVKVEKNEAIVGEDIGHPVSELQRVGFVRVSEGEGEGGRWYLSAPGARVGGGELDRLNQLTTPKKQETSVEVDQPTADQSVAEQPVAEQPETLSGAQDEAPAVGPLDDVQTSLKTTEVVGTTDNEAVPDPISATPVEAADADADGPRPKKRRKTKRHALAAAVVAEEEEGSQQAVLAWARAERSERVEAGPDPKQEGRTVTVEKVDDWMCWVIAGTCFEAIPSAPVDTVPLVLADPAFHPEQNTLTLITSDFLTPDARPVDVYLGPMGPLRASTWRSTAPKDADTGHPAVPYGNSSEQSTIYSTFPANTPHVIVVVDLPKPDDIIRKMQELHIQAQSISAEAIKSPDPVAAAPEQLGTEQEPEPAPWIEVRLPSEPLTAGELTIQEALQNAEKQGHDAVTDFTEELQTPRPSDDFDLPHFTENDDLAIDPALNDATASMNEANETPVPGPVMQDQPPPQIRLTLPPPSSKKTDLVPLPLLLVRKDGIGFSTGRSVVAEKIGPDIRWGLRVVDDRSL